MPLPFPYSNKKAGSKASRVMGISTAYRQMPVMPTDFNKRPNRNRAANFTGQWKTGGGLALTCEKRTREVSLAHASDQPISPSRLFIQAETQVISYPKHSPKDQTFCFCIHFHHCIEPNGLHQASNNQRQKGAQRLIQPRN